MRCLNTAKNNSRFFGQRSKEIVLAFGPLFFYHLPNILFQLTNCARENHEAYPSYPADLFRLRLIF